MGKATIALFVRLLPRNGLYMHFILCWQNIKENIHKSRQRCLVMSSAQLPCDLRNRDYAGTGLWLLVEHILLLAYTHSYARSGTENGLISCTLPPSEVVYVISRARSKFAQWQLDRRKRQAQIMEWEEDYASVCSLEIKSTSPWLEALSSFWGCLPACYKINIRCK